uniref:Uncharacterized protein n=1 Tax=Anguilla anguilla TaxID=7936 RepID=A0A0E9SIM4_ANGAN
MKILQRLSLTASLSFVFMMLLGFFPLKYLFTYLS